MTWDAEAWMRVVRRYVLYCFNVRSVPRVDELASRLSMTRETLTRRFHAATGVSPAATFRAMQLRRAKWLLARSDQPTAEIAGATAFGSTRAFYRTFLRDIGITPTEYRRRQREKEVKP